MKKITLLGALLVCFATGAQNFEWVKTPPVDFDMNPDMIGYCTTTDPSGNIYFTGFKANAFPYEDIMGDQYYNKYASTGELLFSKQFTGRVNIDYITADSQGNVLMAVGYVNNLAIDNLALNTNAQDVQHHIFKFDPAGTLLWQQQITITDWFVNGFMSIELDAGDNIYIGYDDFQNSYIRKMTPAGETVFTIEQINAGRISSISIDNEGNIYAAGSCVGPNSLFAGVDAGTDFPYNIYAVKYSPAGTFQWLKFVEDITCPAPQIAAFSPDEVYFSSQLYEESVFGNLEVEGPADFFEDMFIVKLNADGDYQWIREVPGSGFMGIGKRKFLQLDEQGNVYFAGRVGGTINWAYNIQTSTPTMSGDLIVLKFSPQGQVLMAKTAGGTSEDRVDCIAVSNGQVYITGMVSGNASFDTLATSAEAFEAYPFLAKIGMGTLGSNDNSGESDRVLLFPNPASSVITLSEVAMGKDVAIYNIMGQQVMQFKTGGTAIPVNTLSAGTYIVKIDGYSPLKFIKR